MIDSFEDDLDTVARHLEILRRVVEGQPIGIVSLSQETENPKHKARYSLRILQDEGLIEPTNKGAVTTEKADEFLEDHGERIDILIDKIEGLKIEVQPPA